jgi:hypothetical protein
MAEQSFYLGSVGKLLYDDADTYEDAVTLRAIRGKQIYLDSAPATANEVARKAEVDGVLYGGQSVTIKLVTNVQHNAGAAEVKTKSLTFTNGVLTAVSAESGWTTTPLT